MNSASTIAAVKRYPITQSPFFNPETGYWAGRGIWPATWIDHPDRPPTKPSVALFRLKWACSESVTVRIHVSADNRYRLFLDGRPIGRGPERGSPERWFYESYDLELNAGTHVLLAQSWWLGDTTAPWAQMSIRSGFLLAAEGEWTEIVSTGLAPWESCIMPGFEFPGISKSIPSFCAVGNRLKLDGTVFPWGFENGTTGDWKPALTVAPAIDGKYRDANRAWVLFPATLPPMLEQVRAAGKLRHLSARTADEPVTPANHLEGESESWRQWLRGKGAVTLPPHTNRVAVLDIDDYCCAYPVLTVSGGHGSSIRIDWAESLYALNGADDPAGGGTVKRSKGHRDEIDGRHFIGIGDEFIPDGGAHRQLTTLWWEAGRYLQITVRTGDQPLSLDAFHLLETRYPLEMDGQWSSSAPGMGSVIPLAVRALQMCSHETYMDCPYYEQLMYVGDTRLQVLTTYVLTRDDRLPRKAVQAFADSQRLSGFTRSAFPSHTLQVIPPFSLWWVCMAHDYRMWRDDGEWTITIQPALRAVMDAFRNLIRPDGLLNAPPEWNFVDWSTAWRDGIPPHADFDPSGVINFQCVLAFLAKAELEDGFGAPDMAARDRAAALALMNAIRRHFWCPTRRLFADTTDKKTFSEHVQCLAILSGLTSKEETQSIGSILIDEHNLTKTTIYFMHYLFEALYRIGRADLIQSRMSLWQNLVDNGLRTTVEAPEPTRSDCHAWGAHPLYHYYASVLGIRPAAPGFQRVRIAPQPGDLKSVEGRLPHPSGWINMSFHRKKPGHEVSIELPDGIAGEFIWQDQTTPLTPGKNLWRDDLR